jgi:hypothetical protein
MTARHSIFLFTPVLSPLALRSKKCSHRHKDSRYKRTNLYFSEKFVRLKPGMALDSILMGEDLAEAAAFDQPTPSGIFS